MKKVKQPGFFDIAERAGKLTEMGDPLVGLNAKIDWEAFRPDLNRIYEKERKSNAGAKPTSPAVCKGYGSRPAAAASCVPGGRRTRC